MFNVYLFVLQKYLRVTSTFKSVLRNRHSHTRKKQSKNITQMAFLFLCCCLFENKISSVNITISSKSSIKTKFRWHHVTKRSSSDGSGGSVEILHDVILFLCYNCLISWFWKSPLNEILIHTIQSHYIKTIFSGFYYH